MNQSARDPFRVSASADERSLVDLVEARLRTLIESGVLRPGERLPPTRELASRAGVNRGVLLRAIRRLEMAGRLKTRVGSGVTVAPGQGRTPAAPDLRFSSAISRVHLTESSSPVENEVVADFSRLAPDERFFPIEEFVEILAATSRRHKELWGYSSPSGLRGLRAEIAQRLAESGAPWGEDDVLVTSGAQQGLDLLFKTFVDPGDAVAVESPTYPGILPLLRFSGAEILEVPVERGARDFSRLLGRSVRLAYTMPERHNPTGSTMDAESRRRFLAAALGSGAVVIEDGYERSSSGHPPLSAIEKGRVVNLGSFSKDLVPGLRLGWIAADRPILRALLVAKQTTDLQTPLPLQAATAEFLKKGLDAEVLRERTAETRARRALLVESISRLLPGLSFEDAPDSPIVWLELPVGSSGRETARVAAAAGVRVAAGADFDPFGRDLPALRLSVSRIERSAISKGIARLSEAIETAQRESGSALAIPAL
ncbi:MAG: PLP-dependent aminotransferase family protein [Thermoanaerobaculia bacterium]